MVILSSSVYIFAVGKHEIEAQNCWPACNLFLWHSGCGFKSALSWNNNASNVSSICFCTTVFEMSHHSIHLSSIILSAFAVLCCAILKYHWCDAPKSVITGLKQRIFHDHALIKNCSFSVKKHFAHTLNHSLNIFQPSKRNIFQPSKRNFISL